MSHSRGYKLVQILSIGLKITGNNNKKINKTHNGNILCKVVGVATVA